MNIEYSINNEEDYRELILAVTVTPIEVKDGILPLLRKTLGDSRIILREGEKPTNAPLIILEDFSLSIPTGKLYFLTIKSFLNRDLLERMLETFPNQGIELRNEPTLSIVNKYLLTKKIDP